MGVVAPSLPSSRFEPISAGIIQHRPVATPRFEFLGVPRPLTFSPIDSRPCGFLTGGSPTCATPSRPRSN